MLSRSERLLLAPTARELHCSASHGYGSARAPPGLAGAAHQQIEVLQSERRLLPLAKTDTLRRAARSWGAATQRARCTRAGPTRFLALVPRSSYLNS